MLVGLCVCVSLFFDSVQTLWIVTGHVGKTAEPGGDRYGRRECQEQKDRRHPVFDE